MLRFVFRPATYFNFSVTWKLQQHFPNAQHQSKWKNNHKRSLLINFVIQHVISCHFLLFCFNSLQIRNKNNRGKSPPWILALAFFKQREEELPGFACQVATRLFDSFWVSTLLGLRQLKQPRAMSPVVCWRCSSTMADRLWYDKRIHPREAALGSIIGFLGNYSWWRGCKKRHACARILLQPCRAGGSTWRRVLPLILVFFPVW